MRKIFITILLFITTRISDYKPVDLQFTPLHKLVFNRDNFIFYSEIIGLQNISLAERIFCLETGFGKHIHNNNLFNLRTKHYLKFKHWTNCIDAYKNIENKNRFWYTDKSWFKRVKVKQY